MHRRSRRARLVMLTAVGALLLAAVPGLADAPNNDDDATDTVTINVDAAARTIELNVDEPEEPATFEITAEDTELNETVTDRKLDYVNPGEAVNAKITVGSNITEAGGEVPLGDLRLAVKAAQPEDNDDGTPQDEGEDVDGVNLNEAGDSDSDLITGIGAGANVADLDLTYTLTGNAPGFVTGEDEDNELEVTVTYTITDDSE